MAPKKFSYFKLYMSSIHKHKSWRKAILGSINLNKCITMICKIIENTFRRAMKNGCGSECV